MNAQQEKSVVLSEADFVKIFTAFRPDEQVALLIQMESAVKGSMTA